MAKFIKIIVKLLYINTGNNRIDNKGIFKLNIGTRNRSVFGRRYH